MDWNKQGNRYKILFSLVLTALGCTAISAKAPGLATQVKSGIWKCRQDSSIRLAYVKPSNPHNMNRNMTMFPFSTTNKASIRANSFPGVTLIDPKSLEYIYIRLYNEMVASGLNEPIKGYNCVIVVKVGDAAEVIFLDGEIPAEGRS